MNKPAKFVLGELAFWFLCVLFGMFIQQQIIRKVLFDKGEFILDLGRGKIVGHVEVELSETKRRWVPAGADSR